MILGKIRLQKRWLLNQHVSPRVRLKLFDSIINPTAICGCNVLAATKYQISRLVVMQRRILRSIVGWKRVANESWHDIMTRMKSRLDHAMTCHCVEPLELSIYRHQWRYAMYAAHSLKSFWPSIIADWRSDLIFDPSSHYQAFRSIGRPRSRWADKMNEICKTHFGFSWIDMVLLNKADLYAREDDFIEFCCFFNLL